jgi:hypothetical protein
MAAPHSRPLGVSRGELPRICPARLPRYPLQTILRQVLVGTLENLRDLDLGLGTSVTFSRSDHQGAQGVGYTAR